MESILYAEKRSTDAGEILFWHIYPHPNLLTNLCGVKADRVVKVKVRPAAKDEESRYWGWWDSEKKTFAMIYPSKLQSDICFPGGAEAAEKAGRGKQVNVKIEEVEND